MVTQAILHCPKCGAQHVEKGKWAKFDHAQHLCYARGAMFPGPDWQVRWRCGPGNGAGCCDMNCSASFTFLGTNGPQVVACQRREWFHRFFGEHRGARGVGRQFEWPRDAEKTARRDLTASWQCLACGSGGTTTPRLDAETVLRIHLVRFHGVQPDRTDDLVRANEKRRAELLGVQG
jgi:hypothetical protein